MAGPCIEKGCFAPPLMSHDDSEPQCPHEASVPPFLRPPPRSDADPTWGLGTETTAKADPALQSKLAHFHDLKARGIHVNGALARNRAFHNPHISAKLVEWTGIDEYGSHHARGMRPKDVADEFVRQHGSPSALAEAQRRDIEERRRQRTRIDFTR